MNILEGIGHKRWLFQVVAVVAHKGEVADIGHYFAYVKRKGELYLMNDETITKFDFEVDKKKEDFMKSVYAIMHKKVKEEFEKGNNIEIKLDWKSEGSECEVFASTKKKKIQN